jgi:hypothetical protein
VRARRRAEEEAAREWHGAYAPYDLVKEFVVAVAVVALLAIGLTVLFSSPDERPSTIAQWSRQMPADFLATAVTELDGSSGTAGYGPPYNHNAAGQHIAFVRLQKWLGVSHPIDTAHDYVIGPLRTIAADPSLQRSIGAYQSAPVTTQAAWTTAYTTALGKASTAPDGSVRVPAGSYGPVAPMMSSLLGLARSGGLDGALLTSRQFFQTDYTKPLLFMADGGLLAGRAESQHLLGTQWGMMNETGSFPGQAWLWLYTLWYQVKPFSTSHNADALVMLVMGVLSLAFVLIPFLPGVRDIPRRIPVYRLIWRDHYRRRQRTASPVANPGAT